MDVEKVKREFLEMGLERAVKNIPDKIIREGKYFVIYADDFPLDENGKAIISLKEISDYLKGHGFTWESQPQQ